MPASYMDSSESGDEADEDFANHAQACDQMEFVGPFARTVVQSAKQEQSLVDYFGPPVLRLSQAYKKRTQISELLRPMIEMEDDREPTIPSQPSLVDSTALFGKTSGTPDLALLQALARVEGKYHRFRLLRESDRTMRRLQNIPMMSHWR
jgi:hypothetical protein